MRRRAVLVLPALVLLPAVLAGCGDDARDDAVPAVSAPAGAVAPTGGGTAGATATGTFAPYAAGATAVTYDPALVPPGAVATVTLSPAGSGTTVRLAVTRLQPGRGYGAHLHVKPCGPTGDAAGPHYQHHPDPAASASPPSVDPSYANPANEVWLDFTTDGSGDATTTATQPWTFDPARAPRSVIIHAQPTKTAPGVAGTAGARLGCLTLPG
ncbi:superoxide dismutase family protein [Dactylosporangium sp. NPDC000521]|uniref:superoxide dismutase family protein n=1 Tax=Dactylosporangium sp. NPDC000521 TaxID=3363975 RepID=UPI0036CF6AC3